MDGYGTEESLILFLIFLFLFNCVAVVFYDLLLSSIAEQYCTMHSIWMGQIYHKPLMFTLGDLG